MKIPSQKTLIGLIVGFIVLLLIAGAATYITYQVYQKRDGSALTRTLGGWFPVAKVGSETVRYGDFLKTRETVKTYLASEAARALGAPSELTPEIEQQALDRLVRERITLSAAHAKGITVTEDEVRNSFEVMVAMNSSTIPDVGEFLRKNYQWTEDEFRANVIRPAIIEERLAAVLSSSTVDQWSVLESFVQGEMESSNVKIYLKFN
jgi:hypothetical protein